MCRKRGTPINEEFDQKVKTYIIYLAHVKNSLSLSIAAKSDLIKSAELLSHDVFVSTEGIKAKKINQFNAAEAASLVESHMKRLSRSMSAQIDAIERAVVIDTTRAHSVKDAVESLALSGPNLVVLGKDKVDRLFSFRQFFGHAEKPLDVKKETAKAAAAWDEDFYNLGLKAFIGMLISPTHSGEERYFQAVTMLDGKLTGQTIPIVKREDFIEGLCFIENGDGPIIIMCREPSCDIELSVDIRKNESDFSISLQGHLECEKGHGRFSIDEHYSASLYDSVMKTFKLNRLLEAWRTSQGDR